MVPVVLYISATYFIWYDSIFAGWKQNRKKPRVAITLYMHNNENEHLHPHPHPTPQKKEKKEEKADVGLPSNHE